MQSSIFLQVEEIIELGNAPQSLIIGRVESIYVDDDCITEENGRFNIDPAAINPLGRLGGSDYCTFGEAFTINPNEF